MRCEWAACREAAFRQIDGWWMCEPHKQEHDEMFAPPPRVLRRPPTPRQSKPRELRPCGTRSAAARHRSAGEEVCEPCRQAEADYYHQRWLRQKQAAA